MKLGLVGHPVGHSLSPWIHGQLMEQQKLAGTYDLYDIHPDTFDEEIQELMKKDLNGFNITVPYKERMIPHLDELDESARQLGAVNTVKRTNGRWIGFNTDGRGFVDSLKNRYPDIFSAGSKVLLLGSGGAARGIFHALQAAGIEHIDIANRTIDKARNIITDIPGAAHSQAHTLNSVQERLGDYNLIIQTTTVGMNPDSNHMIIPVHTLNKDTVVSDIVYRPMETRFLTEAKSRGAKLHFGHEMLLQQAVYAFQIWTGTHPAASLLLDRFENKLRGE